MFVCLFADMDYVKQCFYFCGEEDYVVKVKHEPS